MEIGHNFEDSPAQGEQKPAIVAANDIVVPSSQNDTTMPAGGRPSDQDAEPTASVPEGTSGLELTQGSNAVSGDAPSTTALSVKQKLEIAQNEDDAACADDTAAIRDLVLQQSQWINLAFAFTRRLASGLIHCQRILDAASSLMASDLPTRTEGLQNRQDGLDLIGRMLDRLPAKTQGLADQQVSNLELARLDVLEISTEPSDGGQRSEEEFVHILSQKVKAAQYQRYRSIGTAKDEAESCRKRLLGLIEKQFLPILDGVDDGERNSRSVIDALKDQHHDAVVSIDAWFSTYTGLRHELLAILASANVVLMDVLIGSSVDYLQHEPFDEEPAPDLPNGNIKSGLRNGYVFVIAGEEPQVLRPAQVILVKNHEETDAS